jgi:predicted nucleic acid-binding protein
MILVDTSVLVDYFRAPSDRVLRTFEAKQAGICGIIRAEILAGTRLPGEISRISTCLNALQQIPLPENIWDRVGYYLALLRSAGFTVPFTDAVIATVAVENKIPLWTRDVHFQRMQSVIQELELFSEP